ncbi:MAG: SPOR domain-containing protein [Xanthomonadales bacterium]|nr:SPOR domain-containing protein [Xanthomonadales bacterium]
MDKALKQRLVGASVLIALAVIVLPMLLSGRPDSEQQQSEQIELPARPDGASFETRRFPLVEETAAPQKRAEPREQVQQSPESDSVSPGATANVNSQLGDTETNDPVANVSTDEVGDVVQQVASQADEDGLDGLPPIASIELPVSEKVDLPVAVAAPVQTTPAQSSNGRYAVQVASLGSEVNAKQLQSNLEAKGFNAVTDTIESDVGRLNRVRVGPYDSEAEAMAAVKKIHSQVDGVSPRMVDLDPAATTLVTNPSDPLVRWVVQLGSFGESSNAENLVTQVRAQGLSAYSEKVTSSSGAAINRVRVGPFLLRGDATKAQQDLNSSLSINGVVMSAD